MTDDTRGYLPYLRALILLQCDDAHPAALLRRAGFTAEEVAELCDMSVAAVAKAFSRSKQKGAAPRYAKRPRVDLDALGAEDISALINARDANTISDAPRAIREALAEIAARQREWGEA